MKDIKQLTAAISNQATSTNSEPKQQLSTETHQHTQEASERSINLVIDLFEDWLRMYGSKLRERQTLDLRTAELWTLAIKNSGISLKEFYSAAEKSLSLEWPPTAAQDFIKLVKGDIASKYPNIEQAYKQATQGKYKHEVIFETAKRVGEWELKTQPEYISYKAWQQHYPIVCEEHSRGANFKVPESHQVEYSHAPVEVGSEADKRISEKLAELRRMAL